MEPNKKRTLFLILALFWTISITVACLVSMTEVPVVNVDQADKIVHLCFYAVFSILWFQYLKSSIQNTRTLFLSVFFLSVSFGILIEVCQSLFTENRQADLKDAIANTIGALLGLAIMALYNKRFKN
ncbi:VanZ family protein [Flavobacterium gossypii]|uniref:VanZ like protein n=2 Tax=Flavobacterium TaxID=237 RepID=A0A495MKH0_9FLAO|nr:MULTISPECIES: VanZ family protein [Flavobacterium]MBA9072915.1 VanZ family protein [Flavobacterium gossypii]RKS25928.1 VanZ like protein [Flavobacterium endophyticum]WDO13382.1 VanZ family protein [Flavobacterium sp. WW92]